ncbi:MAG: glycosyltransferase family 4 protein [Planctomycetota bacterium]
MIRIAIITAGGAGMFCGSCMQDNTLARSLRLAGADAILIPTYTPIRVDEENASSERIFLGGINVYLDSTIPGWRFLPRALKSWLDRPSVVQFLSKRSSSTNAADLGPLSIDLLNGIHGPQKAEIDELIRFLCDDLRPDLIVFSNALLSGVVPSLRSQFEGRLWCLLQGDDIFLDALPEPWRSKAIQLVSRNAQQFDGFLTHSRYYAEMMQTRLSLPSAKFHTIELGIDDQPMAFDPIESAASDQTLCVGYFARICPEKGAWNFLRAAEAVLPRRPELRMRMGGFLPELHRPEFERRSAALQRAFGERFQLCGSPDTREAKFELLRSFDWLCVPTDYREPKGLYVLEAALAGVPSLLPNHGAFPERIASLQAGRLYQPDQPNALIDALLSLSRLDPDMRMQLRQRCLESCSLESSGRHTLHILEHTH